MMRRLTVFVASLLILSSCSRLQQPPARTVPASPQIQSSPTAAATPQAATPTATPSPQSEVVLPIAGYRDRRTQKVFGQYVAGRFTGYHTGDDVEYADVADDVPVYAIADGRVEAVRQASGYGGVMMIKHSASPYQTPVWATYGHLDLTGSPAVGEFVRRGQRIAVLGDHQSAETGGERKHLHFHHSGDGPSRLAGYVELPSLGRYLNPTGYFARYGVDATSPARPVAYGGVGSAAPPSPAFSGLGFTLPAGWAIEYVPQLDALNLFTLAGDGSARNRSQIFIRHFTADQFLTLPTVTIHQANEGKISGYAVIRYDIIKKTAVPNFPHQPDWRNRRHIVTDVRVTPPPGRSVFFVVAKNPGLEEQTYADFLDRLRFNLQ